MMVPRKPVARKPVPTPSHTGASIPASRTSDTSVIAFSTAPTTQRPASKEPSIPSPRLSVVEASVATEMSMRKAAPVQAQWPSQWEAQQSTGPSWRSDEVAPENHPPPSPSDSLSSLLSAYSRSSNGSVCADGLRSSDGTGSTRGSEVYTSPKPESLITGGPGVDTPTRLSAVTGSRELSQAQDMQRNPATALPQGSGVSDMAHVGPGTIRSPAPSPSRPQIWRRRSLKGSRELPDLRIDDSHGSTASSRPPQPPPKSLADPRSRLASQGPADPHLEASGVRVSNPVDAKQSTRPSPHGEADTDSTHSGHTMRPTSNRPPTPEYQKEDTRTPILDTFVSPVSPASSPEPPPTIQGPPEPARRELPKQKHTPFPSSPMASFGSQSPGSLPDLKVRIPSSTGEPPVPLRGANISRSGTPVNEPTWSVARESGDSVKFPPRDSSARGDALRHGTPSRSSADMDRRLVRSDSQGTLFKGKDGTLYPMMKPLAKPDPKALEFPAPRIRPLPEGAAVKAVPPKDSHFNCFQKHRVMKRVQNKRSPLTCQTCERDDKEDRWSCSFCHLRICESCSQALDGYGKDLKRLMHDLQIHTTIHLTSSSRPGSALGLQSSS